RRGAPSARDDGGGDRWARALIVALLIATPIGAIVAGAAGWWAGLLAVMATIAIVAPLRVRWGDRAAGRGQGRDPASGWGRAGRAGPVGAQAAWVVRGLERGGRADHGDDAVGRALAAQHGHPAPAGRRPRGGVEEGPQPGGV